MVQGSRVQPAPRAGIWRAYFETYGGARALVSSRYLHVALTLNVISVGRWTKPGWWDEPLAVLPNMLGFSLGGYAVLLAFGDSSFRETLAGRSAKGASPFLVMNTTFVHFIVLQTLTLLFALLCKNTYVEPADLGVNATSFFGSTLAFFAVGRYCFWFLGHTLFLYAICLALAATMAVFRVARWYDEMVTTKRRNKPPSPPPEPPHEFL